MFFIVIGYVKQKQKRMVKTGLKWFTSAQNVQKITDEHFRGQLMKRSWLAKKILNFLQL